MPGTGTGNAQERVPFLNHALVNPPVDRNKPHEEIEDVYMHCIGETDEGIIVFRGQSGGLPGRH